MLLVDIWVREMKEKIEGRHPGLEAQIKNPSLGGASLSPARTWKS